jgi:C4-dicarboxylate-specific signal transduction histidine kinase
MTDTVRILLVEDSPSDRELIKRVLGKHRRVECQVTAHETLAGAVAELNRSSFDIILLDLTLPDSQGLESLQTVMKAAPKLPVVVLSGLQDEETAVQAVEQGAQDFLTKGQFDADLLVRSILYAIQRKRLELRLQTANDELERRVEQRTEQIRLMQDDARRREEEFAHAARLTILGEMMTGLAHEVNQPLMSIVAFASTAQQLASNNAPHRELDEPLDRIVKGATLAGEIIRRLRRMVRRREPQTGRLHMNNVVREAMEFLTREIESRNVEFDLDLASYLPVISGDRIQLQQVVLNLVNNALQAIDRAGELDSGTQHRVIVSTKLNVSSGDVVTQVTNTGPLISDSEMEQLFDPFYTTHQEGLGLGLAISKSIVESHGGQIAAEHLSDQRTAFMFNIPSQVAGESSENEQDDLTRTTATS